MPKTAPVEEKEKPKLIVVAGPNGSGKTTITEKLLRHAWMQGCVYINPDYIARDDFGDWNCPQAVKKAADKARDIRETCLAERKNFAFETVYSIQEKLEFIIRAKKSGYFVRMFFICTDNPVINVHRIAKRIMLGGHHVAPGKVISRYYRSIKFCVESFPFADRIHFYDNSQEDEDPRLIFRVKECSLWNIHTQDIPEWAAEIKSVFLRKGA